MKEKSEDNIPIVGFESRRYPFMGDYFPFLGDYIPFVGDYFPFMGDYFPLIGITFGRNFSLNGSICGRIFSLKRDHFNGSIGGIKFSLKVMQFSIKRNPLWHTF